MMPADQAAKVLREHNAWRRRGSMDKMPHSAQTIGHAIDAAVAALEVAAVPVAWRTEDWKVIVRDEHRAMWPSATIPLYAAPQPAYCCAKCGLAEMRKKPDDQRCGACNDIHDTLTPCNNDHEDDAA